MTNTCVQALCGHLSIIKGTNSGFGWLWMQQPVRLSEYKYILVIPSKRHRAVRRRQAQGNARQDTLSFSKSLTNHIGAILNGHFAGKLANQIIFLARMTQQT